MAGRLKNPHRYLRQQAAPLNHGFYRSVVCRYENCVRCMGIPALETEGLSGIRRLRVGGPLKAQRREPTPSAGLCSRRSRTAAMAGYRPLTRPWCIWNR
jgi:hypothetical protein